MVVWEFKRERARESEREREKYVVLDCIVAPKTWTAKVFEKEERKRGKSFSFSYLNISFVDQNSYLVVGFLLNKSKDTFRKSQAKAAAAAAAAIIKLFKSAHQKFF